MVKQTRICKVCGVEYPYCSTVTNDRFRWQDVACCPEHATEYFALVEKARAGEIAPAKNKVEAVAPVIEAEPEVEEVVEEKVEETKEDKREDEGFRYNKRRH